MVERHKAGAKGKRGSDLMGQIFGELVAAMDITDADVLGDLFQGAINYGQAGTVFHTGSGVLMMPPVSPCVMSRARKCTILLSFVQE